MQKLVTVYLKALNHGEVMELLNNYLDDGWHISSITAAGAGEEHYRSFLVAVLLEK